MGKVVHRNYTGSLLSYLLGVAAMKQALVSEKYSTKQQTHMGQRVSDSSLYIYSYHGDVRDVFHVIDYTYPQEYLHKNFIERTVISMGGEFYDDSIEEKLGGGKEVLG